MKWTLPIIGLLLLVKKQNFDYKFGQIFDYKLILSKFIVKNLPKFVFKILIFFTQRRSPTIGRVKTFLQFHFSRFLKLKIWKYPSIIIDVS